jgi:hypothetical protein
MRGMPNLTIVDPCDSVDIEQGVPALAAAPGPTYMRLLRDAVPTVLDEYDYRFELGKAAELRTGRDIVMISTGRPTSCTPSRSSPKSYRRSLPRAGTEGGPSTLLHVPYPRLPRRASSEVRLRDPVYEPTRAPACPSLLHSPRYKAR